MAQEQLIARWQSAVPDQWKLRELRQLFARCLRRAVSHAGVDRLEGLCCDLKFRLRLVAGAQLFDVPRDDHAVRVIDEQHVAVAARLAMRDRPFARGKRF